MATADLVDWDVRDAGELFVAPEVADGEVTWQRDLTWTEADGFE